MENLCEDCSLRESSLAETFQNLLDRHRVNPENPADLERIETQPNGDKLLVAIDQSRPERCQELSKLLPPPPRKRRRGIDTSRCPEFRLIAGLMTADDIEKFNRADFTLEANWHS